MSYRLGHFTVKNWNSWEHVPRDPVTIGTAIVTGLGGSAALAATTIALGATVAGVVGYLAISAVTSWALSALAPKPSFGDPANTFGSQGTLVNSRDAAAPASFVYGKVRKGGVVTYYESTDSTKYLHQIIVLAAHEIEAIDSIYINDEIVTINGSGFVTDNDWNSKIRIQKFLGDQTAPPADLLSESELTGSDELTNNFVGNGIAYLYVRYEYDQDVFASGVPLVTALIRGKKVFDPRTGNTVYSNNAALCIRDFIASNYGLNDGAIDEVAFAAAANECDEDVTLAAGGTEKRYTINGIVSSAASIGKVLGDMTTACAGTLFWGSGYWKLKVGAYSAPVKTLTLDDLRGPINLQTRSTMRDSFNSVSGTFNDSAQDFITADYPPVKSSTFQAEDGGDELSLDLPLPFTTSAATAQRIARMTLYRGREQITISADFGLEAFNVEVGDTIAFTNDRYGFDEKEFEVVGWKFASNQDAGDLRVTLTLQETSAVAFDWNADESAIIGNNTRLPVYTEGMTIFNLSVVGGGNVAGDGTFINNATLSWDAVPNAYTIHYEVQWRKISDSTYASTIATGTSIELSPLIDGVEYTFRVRAVSAIGFRGPFASVTFTGGGDETDPAAPTSLIATGGYQYVTLEWVNPPDRDFRHVEVYEGSIDDVNSAVSVGISSGNSFTRFNLPNDVRRYYWVRSVDFSGNTSAFTTSVNAITAFLEDEDFVGGIEEIFKEQGLYLIEDVTSLPALGEFTGQKIFNRNDGKLYEWDGSAWALIIAEPDTFIASDKIIANTITGGLLATSGIISQSAQIENATITTLAIQNQAVTIPTSAYTSGNVSLGGSGNTYNVQSINFQSTGAPVFIDMSFAYTNGSVGSGFDIQLRRGSTTVYSSGNRDAFSSNKGAWSASFKDTPGFGSVTYTLRVVTTQNCSGTAINQRSLMALEVKR